MTSMDTWRAEQARKNADPTYSMCETHDAAGECDAECLALVQAMSGDHGDYGMVYSDYLGGTSSIDVSGCHGGPPRVEEDRPMLDTERKRIYYVIVRECRNCGEPITEDDNGAGGTVWVHDFGSTVCYDYPPGTHEDGDTTTVAQPTEEP